MARYLELARELQRFTLGRLGYLAGASDCATAPYISYRRSDAEPGWVDFWYQATQIGADVALLAADPVFGRCTIDKASQFVDRFWDRWSRGYLARARPDGSQFLRPDKYCDDHGHFGLMMLDAYDVLGDVAYLDRARRAASFLQRGRVWDDTFDGGFWWNTWRGRSLEGKPAQANGLAAALFYRLHSATGEASYLRWADRVMAWLDARLYDERVGLYRWSRHFEDLERRRGEVLDERFFNYDQAIVIDALLTRYRLVERRPADLARAQALAARLEQAFWQEPQGGFNLVAGGGRVFAIYSAWLTPSLVALYRVDEDPTWLDLARRNVDAMVAYLCPAGGGVCQSGYLSGREWLVDRTIDTVANAGLQWAAASLAAIEARG